MALYKIVGGGPFSRWEPTPYGEEQRTYVVGETVELTEANAEWMNQQIAKIDRDLRRVELAEAGATEPERVQEQITWTERVSPEPTATETATTAEMADAHDVDEGGSVSPEIFTAAEQALSEVDAIVVTAPTDQTTTADTPTATPADVPPTATEDAASAEDAAAPDWATYLTATRPSEACAAISALTSPDDIRAALTAERAGAKRPRVIKAAVARLKELGATVAG